MTITHDTMTVDAVLQAVRQLAPTILDRAGEIETGRRVPVDLLDRLRAAGCFRLVRPATHGGLEAPVEDAMRALESLARADASVAWTVMIGAGSWIDLAHLPREPLTRCTPPIPTPSPPACSTQPARSPHSTAHTRSVGAGALPAGANTLTSSSATPSKASSMGCRSCVARSSLRATS